MKPIKPLRAAIYFLGMALALAVFGQPPAQARDAQTTPAQRQFATPEDAIKALRDAASTGDKTAMHQIFGPRIHELMTGDDVQDRTNFAAFSRAVEESCRPEREGDNEVTLNIGAENRPFPIPLVKTNGQWIFDTDAGIQEIINWHIGRGELNAIYLCRAYVEAQKKYFALMGKYARKFKSAPGAKDGLYWEAGPNEHASPFAQMVEVAREEGYGNKNHTGLHAFKGYIFRILTAQGSAAPGGRMDYLENGDLKKGFAMVAYPEKWGRSGIMTFIVNQDGKVYQRNLGADTEKIGAEMTEYNPTRKWKLEEDAGIAAE